MPTNDELLTVAVAETWLAAMAHHPQSTDEADRLWHLDSSLLRYSQADFAAIDTLCRHKSPLPDDGRWIHPWNRCPRLRLGIRGLCKGMADRLAAFEGWLSLENLETLSGDDERALARRTWPTSLDALRELHTRELAHHLGRFCAEQMDILNGWPSGPTNDLAHTVPQQLRIISDDAAEALASYRPLEEHDCGCYRFMVEEDLTALTQALASLLVTANADLVFLSLRELPADAAAALSQARRGLSLPALEALSVGAAAGLAAYSQRHDSAYLRLDGCKVLSEDVASILGRSDIWRLSLDGLSVITDDVAAALSGFRGERLSLEGVESLSENARRHLQRIRPGVLSLSPTATIDGE
ncbi:MAG: hypothetical protein ACKO3P_20195 [Planctomycetaceae bacterium]